MLKLGTNKQTRRLTTEKKTTQNPQACQLTTNPGWTGCGGTMTIRKEQDAFVEHHVPSSSGDS